MKLSKEEKDLLRHALIAMQEKDESLLNALTHLGSHFDSGTAKNQLFDRIDAVRALHVRLLQEEE
ncbi:MAG: hypothetical protein WAV09_03180 [Minisyncoccia bacterium]